MATKSNTWVQSQQWQNDLCSFPFNSTVIQVYAPARNVKEAEVKQFYDDLQDLLELTPGKDILFIIVDWHAKVGVKRYLEYQPNLALEYKTN